jgi:hypothetical protein
MGYRIPEPPLDPPERRLTADDIEGLLEEAKVLQDKVHGALWLAEKTPMFRYLDWSNTKLILAKDQLENAYMTAREYEEGE